MQNQSSKKQARSLENFTRGLISTARPVNIPSVISQVFTGMCMAFYAWGEIPSFQIPSFEQGVNSFPIPIPYLPFIAVLAFYLAGMWGNDAMDAPWDARHKPDKPIPRGIIRRKHLTYAAFIAYIAGAALIPPGAYIAGGLLGLFILLYTFLHKRLKSGVLLIAACRACVIFIGLTAVTTDQPPMVGYVFASGAAILLFLYITLVSIYARSESVHKHRIARVGFLLANQPILDVAWLLVLGFYSWALIPVACLILGHALRRSGLTSS